MSFDLTGIGLAAHSDYTLRLGASSGNADDFGFNAGFDNLRLVRDVPAPAPFVLMGAGIVALGLRARGGRGY